MPRPKKVKEYYPARLMALLGGIAEHGLTAVCAPAGSGKTTALREYCARQKRKGVRLFWYSAFGETPDTSWERICDMLAEVDPDVAPYVQKLGFPTRQNLSLLAELAQQLRCDTETVFVVDNAQLFGNGIPYELLCALSMHQARLLHFVVITQDRLDLPEVPFNAPGVLFIGADAFLFDAKESDAYFKCNGMDLTQQQLRQVMENTLGWAAALRLQLVGCWKTGAVQKEASMDQLLQTVLWDEMSEEERALLRALSLLEYATPRQVCIMLGAERLPAYARRLLGRGGLVTYDTVQNHYVVHQLLREFAQKRMQERPEAEQRTLFSRAAEVYVAEERFFPAMRCLLSAADYAALMALPLANADMAGYGTRQVVAVLRQVLAGCPRHIAMDNPAMLMRFAFELLMRGEAELYRATCAMIEEALRQYRREGEARRRELLGEFVFLRSFEHLDDIVQMNAMQREAFAVLGGHSKAFDHHRYWTFGIPSALTLFWTGQGSLAEQVAYFEDAMPVYIQLASGHGTGLAELMRAEAHLHAGEADDAEIMSHRTLYLAQEKHQDTASFGALLTMGRIAVLRGDSEGYRAALDHIHDMALTGTEKTRHMVAGQCTALLEMALGRLEGMPDWLVDEAEIRNQMYENCVCYGMRLHAQRLLLKGDYRRLIGYAEPLLERARQQRARLLVIYYLVYLACAKQAIGAGPEAVSCLMAALEIALPNRVYLPFAEHLDGLEPVLAKIHSNTRTPDIARVVALGKQQRAGAARVRRRLYGLGEKLTPREAEVATLAQKGRTNKEIGAALGISPETAKVILQRVFKKLQIHSRTQLIDKNFDTGQNCNPSGYRNENSVPL